MANDNLLLLVPSLKLGGQERIAIHTAEIMKEIKQVTIAVFDARDMVYDTDVEVVDLKIPASNNKFMRVVNVLRRLQAVRALKRERKITYTLSFGATANLVNALSHVRDRVILSVHGYRSIPKGKAGILMWKLLYHKVDKVLCVAKQLSEELTRVCRLKNGKVVTVYNPYDVDQIKLMTEETTTVDISKPSVVSVGRMEDVKGFRHLLRAAKLACEKKPELQLVLVGDGVLLPQLKELAADLGIEDRVRFVGFQKNPFAILSKCDCYVLSSIHEGFPNALVEAMACGLPAIAVDCETGPREILGYEKTEPVQRMELCEYGVLCPAFESDTSDEPLKEKILADAIVQILDDKNAQAAYRIHAELRAKMFSFEQYRERLLEVVF